MHIKQVFIEGFKSYRDEISTQTFSPKLNCLVGANGSGKSNFFHAICFVISDLFHGLRDEEMQALLHEGAGDQILSATVEIVFHNLDKRIHVDKEEFRLRRTIGVAEDGYCLDGKDITKAEVTDLLESAGFLHSNPYFVVQQGNIASLTLMKDSERLDLLKEIGETRVYEERHRQALKIMQETGNKTKEIIHVIKYLNHRLHQLYEEKEELKKYQQLDEERKSLEYAIYHKELLDAKQQLAKRLEDENQTTLQDVAKVLMEQLCKKDIYTSKQEEYSKKIRELGPLSSDAFEKYKKKSLKELLKLLTTCNSQLKQFWHVNIKALDQYARFKEQRDELQKRQAELDAGHVKMQEFVSSLAMRKDESIEHTFEGLDKHFQEVFSELVQGGHGFLVLMKKKDLEDADDDEPHTVETEGRVEKYFGVKVKVSFTAQGEARPMKQLSEGQKTVVALALIFATQRYEPAPCYLFDDIDAELEPQYRTAVGNMVRRVADMGSTQFIAATFGQELVKVADKIFHVTRENRVSCVNVTTKEDALDFIHHNRLV